MPRKIRSALGLFVLLATLLPAGCASGPSTPATAASDAAPVANKPRGVAPPASSRLATVALGMSPDQVRERLGPPGDRHAYPTGKQWIPFYYGSDVMREEWKYAELGRVVFSRGAFSKWKVMRVDHDPNEKGH